VDTAAQPNILFVITDQQRADHVGFGGNDVVRTPNLDLIAGRGTVFDNAWVANPFCMPNRSSILTSRLPSSHGVVFNDRSLDWGATTFVRTLNQAGWRTGLIGKSHLQHGVSRNAVTPTDRRPVSTTPWPEGWDTLEHFERYENEPPEFPTDFYGFDHVELSIDHGSRITGHHLHWALDRGGRYEDLVVPMSSEAPALQRSKNWWQVYQPPYGPELHSTEFVTDRTINFIREAAAQSKPWMAFASFPDPHHPMTPPGDWYRRHNPADIELPSTISDPLTNAPQYLQRIAKITADRQRIWVSGMGASEHDLVRDAIASTYDLIEFIDDGVGRIVQTIEDLGMTENTIVVFTSDHGDMMGDHGLLLKGFMHYRGALQVPMVIAAPGFDGARSSCLASSVDVGMTMLDLVGLDSHIGSQGVSLRPILDNPTTAVRETILIEDDFPSADGAATPLPAKTRTVVANGLKYTRHSTGDEQLFDLERDTDEMANLAPVDTERKAEAMELLVDAMIHHSDDARGIPASL